VARYEVDPQASAVAIAARSTIHPVHIAAHGLNGYLEGELGRGGRVDLKVPHRARLSMPVSQMRSGNPVQDMEMDRRMETGRYPTIDCEVDRLVANGRGGYRASARVMVHGQTRAVEAEVLISTTGPGQVVIDVEHVFDMRDFGINPPSLLIVKVEPQVAVRVRIEAAARG
jgi:hypothetical protein